MGNRAARRAMLKGNLKKQYIKMGFNTAQIKLMAENSISEHLHEGDKVKIDYEFCIRHKQYKSETDAFKKFVEDNKDAIFTVKYDPKRVEAKALDLETMIMFEEDPNGYLFDSCTLKVIEHAEKATATVKTDDGEEKVIDLGDITDPNDPEILKKVNKALE